MKSEKEWLTTLLLCLFLGSLGGCGIWTIIDLIMILTGKFTDKDGNEITNN